MRLLIISPGLFENDIGGVANVVRHLTLGIVEKGYKVMVFTTLNNHYPPTGEFRGIEYWQFPFRYRSILCDWTKCYRLARELNPDIINVHHPIGGIGLMTILLHMRMAIPIVSSLHFREVTHPNFLDRSVARNATRLSSSITTISRYMAGEVSGIVRKEVVPIHNGVDMASSDSDKTLVDKLPYIAAAGSLVWYKNFATLIKAFYKIAQRHPSIDLKIAGIGTQSAELNNLVRSLGIDKRVSFLGQIKPSEVKELFARALFVVVPSYVEQFGLVAIEAMAVGTSVVVANIGGLTEIVRNGIDGIYADPHDPHTFSSAMDTLLMNPGLRSQLGVNAQKRVADFSWDKMVKSYINVFGGVMNNR